MRLSAQKTTVNCRVGSLENKYKDDIDKVLVNCRVGSLETMSKLDNLFHSVNCRVGSLENCYNIVSIGKAS